MATINNDPSYLGNPEIIQLYTRWIDELVTNILNDKKFNKNDYNVRLITFSDNIITQTCLQVYSKVEEEMVLIIDATSFRYFFDAINEPNYTYESALVDATSNCVRLFNEWHTLRHQ